MPRKKIEDLLNRNEKLIFNWLKEYCGMKTYSADAFNAFDRVYKLWSKHPTTDKVNFEDKYIPSQIMQDLSRRYGCTILNEAAFKLNCGRESTGVCDRITGWKPSFLKVCKAITTADYQQPMTSYFMQLNVTDYIHLNAKGLRTITSSSSLPFIKSPDQYVPSNNPDRYNHSECGRMNTSKVKSGYDYQGMSRELKEMVFYGCYDIDMQNCFANITNNHFRDKLRHNRLWNLCINEPNAFYEELIVNGAKLYDTTIDCQKRIKNVSDAKALRSSLFFDGDGPKTGYGAFDELRELVRSIIPHKNWLFERETEIVWSNIDDNILFTIHDGFVTTVEPQHLSDDYTWTSRQLGIETDKRILQRQKKTTEQEFEDLMNFDWNSLGTY